MRNSIIRFIKGFAIGASMLIPGVSGGTMAILLNIYGELIIAVSRFRANIKKSALVLITAGAGGLLGILILSMPMGWVFDKWTFQVLSFVFGAVIAGTIPLFKLCLYPDSAPPGGFLMDGMPIDGLVPRRGRAHMKPFSVLCCLFGIGIGVGFEFIPAGLIPGPEQPGLVSAVVLFVVGLFFSIPLVLPGISASYVLVIFGIYKTVLDAITNVDILYLAPFAVGTFIGVVMTAKIMDRLMLMHPQATYMMIIGFMLGSLVVVAREGLDVLAEQIGILTIVTGAGVCIVGFVALMMLSLIGGKGNDEFH